MPVLDWIGKDKVVNHHLDVPFHVLERQYSFDKDGKHAEDNGSENMIIHGDNLTALKSLLPKYEGKINCIYIDPPYNTAHSTNDNQRWVYSDNVDHPIIKKWLGEVVGDEGEDLCRHDKWLCMMYPRLFLAWKLLSANGYIFISIGEDELGALKFICDEIFGRNNYCGLISRLMKSGGNKGQFFSPNIDYILAYAKQINSSCSFKAPMDEKIIKKLYKNIETEGPMKGKRYRDFGLYQSSLDPLRGCTNQRYYIQAPDGTLLIPPGDVFPAHKVEGALVVPVTDRDKVWRWSRDRFLAEKEKNNILFKKSKGALIDSNGKTAKWNVYTKIWLENRQKEGQTPRNIIDKYENRHGTKELNAIGVKFDFPKPSKLVEYLISLTPLDSNAIILDSFAGSGSTAHAVLNLNKQDGGNRKFILVELMDYAESITAERVKRVINGYGEGNSAVEGTGGDFSFYELGEPLMENGVLNESVGAEKIREYVYYTETKQRVENKADEPFYLGSYLETAYYFYYLPDEVTTLDDAFLESINTKAERYVIYADRCMLSDAELEKYHVTFKKIPRDIVEI